MNHNVRSIAVETSLQFDDFKKTEWILSHKLKTLN